MESAGPGFLFLKGIRYCHASIRYERMIGVAIALMLCFSLTPLIVGHPSPIVAAAPASFTLDFESGNYWG
ncbi:MAG: hypothetical protein LUQ12_02385, partial [Methanoregulaceae archaeon]|nr:hypothetical protein [Methanoregulaceae archaeon]